MGEHKIDDLLTYALFPQVGINFLENRDNPDFFEPIPQKVESKSSDTSKEGNYTVSFKGTSYDVQVCAGGDITSMQPSNSNANSTTENTQKTIVENIVTGPGEDVLAPLAGNIWKVEVTQNQQIKEGDVLIILEAMKMETEIRAAKDGVITDIAVKEGDSISVGEKILTIG